MSADTSDFSAKPIVQRQQLERVRRNLTVTKVELLTPRMVRITLGGDELAGFVSPSPDDHIKVFFTAPDGSLQGKDYTPRRFDAERKLLSIDFAIHEGGLGSEWAQQAKVGDAITIGGPRGSTVISAPGAWWLLIGDATALPSIGRRLEEAADGTQIFAVVAVESEEEEQHLETRSDLKMIWVHRAQTDAADAAPILKVLRELKLPQGPGFVWIGAETEVSRSLRGYFTDVVGHSSEWIKASAYWSQKPEHE
jgi:NADPH-dependent ferric siderophore reductase